jgi:hypothetical protein
MSVLVTNEEPVTQPLHQMERRTRSACLQTWMNR